MEENRPQYEAGSLLHTAGTSGDLWPGSSVRVSGWEIIER